MNTEHVVEQRLVNLCPHAVRIVKDDGSEIVLQRPQRPARFIVRSAEQSSTVNGVVIKGPAEYMSVSDLPEPVEGTIYIVSQMTALVVAALLPRTDVVYPGSYVGDKPRRDANGRLEAVRCLVKAK